MKKPINISQILALGSFFSIVVVLLGINLMKNKLGGRGFTTDPEHNALLKLDYKTIHRSVRLQPFLSLNINAQYIDSLIFIPSTNPQVDISGNKTLVNALRIHHAYGPQNLILSSKYNFYLKESELNTFKNKPHSLEKGGLVIKIFYQTLYNININQMVETIVHKGVFKSGKLSIYAKATSAQFNVEVKELRLNLEKSFTFPTAKPIENERHKYNDELIQYTNQPLRVAGTADLVETINNGHSILDLTQLKCRHVHADYANAKYSVLEVAPTQLFSYIIRRDNVDHHSEMICKSKALVTKAYYLPELELVERFH